MVLPSKYDENPPPIRGEGDQNQATLTKCSDCSSAQYRLTENYYIINSETIMDVKLYTPSSKINSQMVDVM